MYSFFFFFSSRRRHTRCGRDWSSDVCSSDLHPSSSISSRKIWISLVRTRSSSSEVHNDSPSFSRRPMSSSRFRSEEHTSELQSRPHLVCRLLLEKKNLDGYDHSFVTEFVAHV